MTTLGTLSVIDGLGAQQLTEVVVLGSGALVPLSAPSVGGVPVDPAHPLPTQPGQITAAAGAAHNIATGGTAVVAIVGGSMQTGGYVVNPRTALSMFVDPVNPCADEAPGPNGTTIEIGPGGWWDAPGPLTGNVSVNCAEGDDNHAFTAVIF